MLFKIPETEIANIRTLAEMNRSDIADLLARIEQLEQGDIEPALQVGGLTAWPEPLIGPNLVQNGDFEEVDESGNPLHWSSNGYVSDDQIFYSGTRSYRLTDANTIPYTQSARQTVQLQKGSYQLSCWIKAEGLAANGVGGARVQLIKSNNPYSSFAGSRTYTGTFDWQQIMVSRISVDEDWPAILALGMYSEPDGTIWHDTVELRREYMPVSMFVKYPNYRGILWDDYRQRIELEISCDLDNLEGHVISIVAVDEVSGQEVYRHSADAAVVLDHSFSATQMQLNHAYLLKVSISGPDGFAYEYPAYRIWKLSGELRHTMTFAFDEQNRFLVDGEPKFLMGVYDSGMGYTSTAEAWENLLTTNRRLFELEGLDIYHNYWYGEMPADCVSALMDCLGSHGIKYLQTGNAFASVYPGEKFPIHADDEYAATLAAHPGFAGLYAADEAANHLADEVFRDYLRFKDIDRDGITFCVQNAPKRLGYWLDNIDVLAVNPYPLYGTEPEDGYSWNIVTEWISDLRDSVRSSRPYMSLVQYFKFTSKGRWPTTEELRRMSYMAIVEGANGLFYWSLGAGALAYVESGWGETKTELFERLKTVFSELNGLKPYLNAEDDNELMVSVPDTIHTRVKAGGCIIAQNITNQAIPQAEIALNLSGTVQATVYGESRTLDIVGGMCRDDFEPYGTHVYILEE